MLYCLGVKDKLIYHTWQSDVNSHVIIWIGADSGRCTLDAPGGSNRNLLALPYKRIIVHFKIKQPQCFLELRPNIAAGEHGCFSSVRHSAFFPDKVWIYGTRAK